MTDVTLIDSEMSTLPLTPGISSDVVRLPFVYASFDLGLHCEHEYCSQEVLYVFEWLCIQFLEDRCPQIPVCI